MTDQISRLRNYSTFIQKKETEKKGISDESSNFLPFFFQNLCSNIICSHNGSCLTGFTDKGYFCECKAGSGFTGQHCEKGKNKKGNLLLILPFLQIFLQVNRSLSMGFYDSYTFKLCGYTSWSFNLAC